jgi:4-amino-4-deoxy-L-arabinose transferase-like glycosyltransferase
MGHVDSDDVDEKVERTGAGEHGHWLLKGARHQLTVLVFGALIFLGTICSPPSLMDDVDSVQAQIARNMLQSGDWVTARLDGVPYLEKSPLVYWMMAISFRIFGVHDWAARIPIAVSCMLLGLAVLRFSEWAFGKPAGLYAGLCTVTCAGLFLFTRILIPDCILTLTIVTALYSVLRLLDDDRRRLGWPMLFWAALGAGLLLKGLIGIIFPVTIAIVYLILTRKFFVRDTWTRLRVSPGLLLFLAIAAPWHVLATLRNPPLFDLTMHSESGSYRGFFWFYFINEHVLRFLNRRYPRDYNTVPPVLFWLLNLVWLLPWSFYLPGVFKLDYRGADRAARVRLLAVCWIGVVLGFFTLSTTQEYYSMPCYPALALLIGSAVASSNRAVRVGARSAAVLAFLALTSIIVVLYLVRNTPTPGDIASALTQHPEAYSFSLGHVGDLQLSSFAYLRIPLALAAAALAIGAFGAWHWQGTRAVLSMAIMMAVFYHAARLAMVSFDPYLSSPLLARALLAAPEGQLIIYGRYYDFSSVFFYTDKTALLVNGRAVNLEYGSYAPGAPAVFIGDEDLAGIWRGPDQRYLLVEGPKLPRVQDLLGEPSLHLVKESGGKYLFSNQ